jgi:L-alanine-DL-glutamate epimerase-like enolase superfamily enzyme
MVDVNCPWTADEAFRQAQSWRDLDLYWLESPSGRRKISPVLHGFAVPGSRFPPGKCRGDGELIQLMASGAVDIVQPSVCKVGGISAMLRLFALAHQYPVRVIPHCFYYGAGMLATAHLVALLPEKPALRFLAAVDACAASVLHFQPEMRLPDVPGRVYP